MRTYKIKKLLFLHLVVFIYSLLGVVSKIASAKDVMSLEFIILYGVLIAGLGIYALLWQQAIKNIPLIVSYSNKAATIIWGIIWGRVFFGEKVTGFKIVGAVVIMLGVWVMLRDKDVE